MKSIVIIDSISRAAGGLFDAERRLHQELKQKGVETAVLGMVDEFSEADAPKWQPLEPRTFRRGAPAMLGRSAPLRAALMAEGADLIYRAGLWSLPSRYACAWSKRFRKPEIIAPHGMLDPWAVRNSGWKKKVVSWLYEGENLRHAVCIRALCESEARSIRAFGLKNPIAVIPNGVDLPASSATANAGSLAAPWAGFVEPGRKVLLFLGRIHPKKGLVNLLDAWNRAAGDAAGDPGWVLALAGWDQDAHEAELKQLATGLGIRWVDTREKAVASAPRSAAQPALLFLGPQFNEARAACYASCDAFILPSFSEGLPMVILEAWAYSKPVLMTPECNLPEGFEANAAIRMETNPPSIALALAELFRSSPPVLRKCGDCGHALVTRKFTWPTVAMEMKNVYDWVLGNGAVPATVINK